jgi:hypothetical protein
MSVVLALMVMPGTVILMSMKRQVVWFVSVSHLKVSSFKESFLFKEDAHEPEITFLPNEDVFRVKEGNMPFKITCTADGQNLSNLRVFLYKDKKLIKVSTTNVVEIDLQGVRKIDEGEYVCKAYWTSPLGIGIASKSMEMLVEKERHSTLLAGSSISFSCSSALNGRWSKDGEVIQKLKSLPFKPSIKQINSFVKEKFQWQL